MTTHSKKVEKGVDKDVNDGNNSHINAGNHATARPADCRLEQQDEYKQNQPTICTSLQYTA